MRSNDPSPDDSQELIGLQTGAAYEGAIDAFLRKQRGSVLWLDAAAVLYGNCLSRFRRENLTEAVANCSVRSPSAASCRIGDQISSACA